MPRLAFRNPPVHEVILTLQVEARADLTDLDGAGKLLSEPFLTPERVEAHQVEIVGTPTGEAGARVRREVMGWAFKTAGPTKVVQATREGITIHAVRPGAWPVGPYPGWEVNGPWAFGVFRELAPIYSALGSRRAALRYLNRIAIPNHSDPQDWFAILPPAPRGLSEPSAFQFAHTWDRVNAHNHLSVTVRLAKIAIEDVDLRKDHEGALLDIEVFTRRGEKAPSYDTLQQWFNEAHEVENSVFESCITSELGDRFGRE